MKNRQRNYIPILMLVLLLALPLLSGGCTSDTTDESGAIISISISPANPAMVIGDTQRLAATATTSNNGTADVTSEVIWSSSDETVASIDDSGLVTGVSEGTTTITAYFALSALTATTIVTVSPSGSVAGTVTDAVTGTPISGALITISENRAQTTSAADGTFTFENIPQGDQAVTATKTGYADFTGTVTVVGGQTVPFSFQMTSLTGIVTGTVTDQQSGDPIEGATVSIGLISDVTDAYGVYILGGVTPGDQTLIAIADFYTDYGATVTVNAGATNTWDFVMNPNLVFVADYVPSGTVTVFRANDYSILATYTTGDYPDDICISPDGHYAYVSNNNSESVTVIDVTNLAATPQEITMPVGSFPRGLAISPDGTRLYVTDYWPANPYVYIVDTSTLGVIETVNVGIRPLRLKVSPDGAWVYATGNDNDRVAYFDAATLVADFVDDSYDYFNSPVDLVFSLDGNLLFVTNYGDNNVSVIDTGTNAVIDMVDVGATPYGIDISPDGLHLYVAALGSGAVQIIDTTNLDAPLIDISVSSPYFPAVDSNGAHLYVTKWGNGVTDIDLSTNTPMSVPGLGLTSAYGIDVAP